MDLKILPVGPIQTNCYVLGDEERVAVIDPGEEGEVIENAVGKRSVEYILITHSHYDHIGALNYMKMKYPEAKVAIHESEKDGLFKPDINLSSWMGASYSFVYDIDFFLKDGMELSLGKDTIKVLYTPGHTVGGCCFLIGKTLFSGDTLFRESIGRSDLPGGDSDQLIGNIRKKLLILPDDTVVYPGHMGRTTIGYEKANNEFLQ